MLIRDLVLPNGQVLEYLTGAVVDKEPLASDMTWAQLAGRGVYNPYAKSRQPFVGCLTGGDKVAEVLMNHLVTR